MSQITTIHPALRASLDAGGSYPPLSGLITARHDFLVALALALHRSGAPSHRLEERMNAVAEQLGVRANFFATPTAVFVDLDGRTRLLRVEPEDTHLERLVAVDHVAAAVADGELDARAGSAELRAVLAKPERYGGEVMALGMALAGGSAAVFFGGGWADVLVATVVSVIMGQLSVTLGSREHAKRVLPLLGAALSALIALFLGKITASSPQVTLVAGLIVFIPGLTLTTALAELASHNLAAGTARLASALVTLFQLVLGAIVGFRLGALLWRAARAWLPTALADAADFWTAALAGAALPAWSDPIALAVAATAFTLLFRARPSDLPFIAIGCAVAWWGATVGGATAGPLLGPGLAALAVGVISNVHGRLRDVPASVLLVPGILLLVPGAVGFRGLQAMTRSDTLVGMETAFAMFSTAASLVGGLLAANALFPAKRAL